MKFSICIPTLNEEEYLPILLNALKEQTHKDFEVIVADAKSKDKTIEKADEFKSSLKITTFISPQKGQSFQRNYAASKAKTNNLIFFDADVKPSKNFLKTLDGLVSSGRADSVTAWNIPMSHRLDDHLTSSAFNILYLDIFRKWTHGSVGTFIFVKKDAFKKVGEFDTSLSLAEDFDLSSKLHQAGYNTKILRSPGIHFSVRRLDEEGRLNFYKKMLKSELYLILSKRNYKKLQNKIVHRFGDHK